MTNHSVPGSPSLRSTTSSFCVPLRGSSRVTERLNCNCGEYQISLVTTTGLSLPKAPGLKVRVSRVPVHSRPSMVLVPRLSRVRTDLPSLDGPAGSSTGCCVGSNMTWRQVRWSGVQVVLEEVL